MDAADPAAATQLTFGDTREAAPALSPDRTTVIFQRARPGTAGGVDLIVAGALDGSGERPLFGSGPPAECAFEALRPAWFAHVDRLAVPCVDSSLQAHLLLTDTAGAVLGSLDPPTEWGLRSLGDPSIDLNSTTLLLWASTETDADGGSLYVVDLATNTWTQMLPADGDVYSDPVFSPVDSQTIAYRQSVEGNFEVFSARPDGTRLNDVRLTEAAGKDQDPMFSPDGSTLVFGHVDPGDDGSRQTLMMVPVSGGVDPEPFTVSGLPGFQSVPAWSRR